MGKLLFGIRLLYKRLRRYRIVLFDTIITRFFEEYIVNIHRLESTVIWIDLTPGTNHLFV